MLDFPAGDYRHTNEQTHKRHHQKAKLGPCMVTFIPDMQNVHHTDDCETGTYSILEKENSNIQNEMKGSNCFTDRAEIAGETPGS